jgi:hypothetical protein
VTSASRSSDLNRLSCEESFCKFQKRGGDLRLIPKELKKQSRPGNAFKEIRIPTYIEDRLLDPVRAAKLYLRRVKYLRKDASSFFVTYDKHHRRPVPATIARWLVTVIKLAQDRATNVTAHSTRSTSTSWVSIASILNAADWKSDSTFANHYLKEVRSRRTQFCEAVLGAARPKDGNHTATH